MAARQDQTQTIIIIICSILILVLGFTTYWNGSQWAKEFARAEELQKQKSDADNATRKKVGEAENLLAMIGFDRQTPLADVEEQFQKDKDAYMSTFPEESRSYRSVLEYIYAENGKIAQQEDAAKEEVKALKETLVALNAEKDKQIEEANAAQREARTDLAAERARFDRERESIEREQQRLTQTLARKETEFNTKLSAAKSAQEEAEAVQRKTSIANENLQAFKRSLDAPNFDVADGQVTYVNQANGIVWVDLGDADGLRPQVTFSVFESELSETGPRSRKGSIEVTRVIGDHIAEAQITNDDPLNPVLPGDQVFSPIWKRGQQLRFALTGLIDLDGDGISDLQQAKDLVAVNGAFVDSSLEEDGSIDGKMSFDTGYLVLGAYPDEPSKAAYREGYDKMNKDADVLGVKTINLSDFLNQMGYRTSDEAFQITKNAGARSSGTGGSRPTSYRFRTP